MSPAGIPFPLPPRPLLLHFSREHAQTPEIRRTCPDTRPHRLTPPPPARPIPIQLPLFAETASLVRIRPALNEWRFYRMEIWPDLFGRALLVRQWGRIGTEGHRRL